MPPKRKSQKLLSFHIQDAIDYGAEEAIILFHIRYWVKRHTNEDRNFFDGYYWTFNSSAKLTEKFPFFHYKKISRLLISLEKQGALKSGNYNKRRGDKTKWYTITRTELSKGMDRCVQALPIEEHKIIESRIFKAYKHHHDSIFTTPLKWSVTGIKSGNNLNITTEELDKLLTVFFNTNPTYCKDYDIFVEWALRQ